MSLSMLKSNPVFTNFTSKDRDNWGSAVLNLKHRLHEDPLFSEDALADLIDRSPQSNYDLVTMGAQTGRRFWREGEKGSLKGHEIIHAIATGRFWINLRRVMDVDERYNTLLNTIFAEIEERVPSLGKTFKHNMGVLISSPNAQVYYHCDIPGQSLWQIKGTKRVYIYPTTEKFLPQEAMEGIIIGETEEEIAYDPAFDNEASVVDLEPGEMLTWPLNGPHKVMNHDCLNVSVTTEHWTPAIRNSYAVHFANGMLRRKFGLNNLTHQTDGLGVYPKLALAAALKAMKANKSLTNKRMIDFRVDPSAPDGFVDIEAYDRAA
ncbi:MAG: hypothetical protein AAF668_11745 [Pseudomonadota bacterium]